MKQFLSGKGTFQVDISKREYTSSKIPWQLGGIRIYAYSPAMMVAEKLRAICQQMESYCRHVGKHPTPRARDFVDIQALITERDANLVSDDGRALVRKVFAAKEVPLNLLGKISHQRDFHRLDFDAVRDTVKPNTVLGDFDFYFDFVLDVCEQLKPLWNI